MGDEPDEQTIRNTRKSVFSKSFWRQVFYFLPSRDLSTEIAKTLREHVKAREKMPRSQA